MKEAMFYEKHEGLEVKCHLCPHNCTIKDGKTGICQVRENIGGTLFSLNYGKISSLHLDPVEKKPLQRFMPGTFTLSMGSFGCNMRCPWCQNYTISKGKPSTQDMTPREIVEIALENDYPSISYTYNEPTVYYEFMLDTAKLAREKGIKNIMVTNGFINEGPLRELLKYIDAMNIDLKTYNDKNYKKFCGADLESVKKVIEISSRACHVEITALMVTGVNDNIHELLQMIKWVASINAEIPFHLSRYYPMYKYFEPETDRDRIFEAESMAREYLKYVYTGNI